MTDRKGVLSLLADALETELHAFLHAVRTSSPLYDLMGYHLGWEARGVHAGPSRPGKKVRPLLLLIVNQVLGGDVAVALPVAAAVELLHNAALVFDDIQDGGSLRRGRPAVWRLCGTGQAMNVGVALQACVQLAAARAMRAGLSAAAAQGVAQELGECMLRLAEGQFLDLTFAGAAFPSMDDYMRICGAKTASLLATAAYLGALLAGRDDAAPAARRSGYHLGMFLQLEDDLAGIWGDAAVMGKEPEDLRARRKTLPLLYVFQLPGAPPEVLRLAQRYAAAEELGVEEVEALRDCAVRLGGRAFAEEMAAFHRDLARRALEEVGADAVRQVTTLIDAVAAVSPSGSRLTG